MVVLPLVPVTPTTFIRSDGWPSKLAAARARASRASATWTHVASAAGGFGQAEITAAAPFATASATKSRPLRAAPGSAAKRKPGLTAFEL